MRSNLALHRLTSLSTVVCLLVAACSGGSGGSGPGPRPPATPTGAPPAVFIAPSDELSGLWFVNLGGAECDNDDGFDIVSLDVEGVAVLNVAGDQLTLEFIGDELLGVSFSGTYAASSGDFHVTGADELGQPVEIQGRLHSELDIEGFVFTSTQEPATVVVQPTEIDPEDPLAGCYGEPLALHLHAVRIVQPPVEGSLTGTWDVTARWTDQFGSVTTPETRRLTLIQNGMLASGQSLHEGNLPVFGLLDDVTGFSGILSSELQQQTRGWLLEFTANEGRLVGTGTDFVYAHAGDELPSAVRQFVFEAARVPNAAR